MYKDIFISTAEGKALDKLGIERGVHRKPKEKDDEYRERIKAVFEKAGAL
ncbi:hypothetical protein [Phascolarctobacterium sp.]